MNLPQVFGDFHQHVKLINLNSNTSDIDVSVDKTGFNMGKLISIPSDSPDNNSDSDLNVLTDEPENCCVTTKLSWFGD